MTGQNERERERREQDRLAELDRYQAAVSEPAVAFDELVTVAAAVAGTPMAAVSLVGQRRQHFPAAVGLDAPGMSREVAFCDLVVQDNDELARSLTGDQSAGLSVRAAHVMAQLQLRHERRLRDQLIAQRQEWLEPAQAAGATEQELVRANDLFDQLLSSATEQAIIGADTQGRITIFNRGAASQGPASSRPDTTFDRSGGQELAGSAVVPVASPRPPPDENPSAASGLRILMAEDNEVNQKVGRLMLAKLGYQPEIMDNGDLALEAVHERDFDVVLMDLHMPVMDGLEATRRIRAELPSDRQPRIVALTASVTLEDRVAGAAAGMDSYLSKPAWPDDLAAVLAVAKTVTRD